MMDRNALKRQAAERAIGYVQDCMNVGLGTGSTAAQMITLLAARVAAGLRVRAVATSERSAALAQSLGIPVSTLDDLPRLDLTIDGADEIDLATFGLIKGRGGALLREKIVARASALNIIIADVTKVAAHLGTGGAAVPVEVVPFGWRYTAAALTALGCVPRLRPGLTDATQPYLTDGGHYILDCTGSLADPFALERAIKALTGVVESGLFLGLAGRIIVAGPEGVQVYEKG